MNIEESKIKDALDAAHKEAGQNAYFGNGFNAGVQFVLKELNKNSEDVKDKYFAVAGFANDMQYCDTLKEAQEFLESYFFDQNEGYHPDAESCFIYELKSKAYIYSNDKGLTFKHKFDTPQKPN